MEKRLYHRARVNDGICTMTRDGIFTGAIKNISLGGLLVNSDIKLTVMDRIKIKICLSSASRRIELNTDVVATRVENRAIAFKYDSLCHEGFWTLQSYIQGLSA